MHYDLLHSEGCQRDFLSNINQTFCLIQRRSKWSLLEVNQQTSDSEHLWPHSFPWSSETKSQILWILRECFTLHCLCIVRITTVRLVCLRLSIVRDAEVSIKNIDAVVAFTWCEQLCACLAQFCVLRHIPTSTKTDYEHRPSKGRMASTVTKQIEIMYFHHCSSYDKFWHVLIPGMSKISRLCTFSWYLGDIFLAAVAGIASSRYPCRSSKLSFLQRGIEFLQ